MRRRSRVASSGTVIAVSDPSTSLTNTTTTNGDGGSISSSGAISNNNSTNNTNKSAKDSNDNKNNNNNKKSRRKSNTETVINSQERISFIETGVPMADIPPPASTLSLFTRFQQKSSDFTSDWLLLQEGEMPSTPPISLELSEKLRQYQGIMQKQRNGTSSHSEDKAATTTTTTTTTIATKRTKPTSSENIKSDNDNDDDEYTPHGLNSMNYGSQPSSDNDKDVVVDDDNNNNDNDGLRGDYLSLLPFNGTREKIAKSDLQVTVTLQEGVNNTGISSETLLTRGTRNFKRYEQKEYKQQQYDYQQQQRPVSKTASPMLQRVVPLWCLERFTTQNGYASNPLIALHQEICDFVKFLRPSQAEVTMRRLIEMEVTTIAKRLWPECEPIVYGSMSTHLLLPLSDLDMTILNVPVSTEEALTALSREISREGLCHAAYPQLILKTKVPLVKFQHRLSLLDVDISINAGDGQRNSAIVVDMLQQFPEARPLIVVVKYFLQQRGMHEPYHGGLGSFATTLLVISFLQHHPIYTSSPEERVNSGLGRLLVDFFRYYGMYFSYNRCGISLLDGGRYFQRTDTSNESGSAMQRSAMGPPQVLIEDPGCPQNNAASSLRNFHVITSVFAHAYMALTAVFNSPSDGVQNLSPDSTEIARRPTLLSRILHVDAPSVKRRQSIAAAYDTIMGDITYDEKMKAVLVYRRTEDELILKGRNPETSATLTKTTLAKITTTTVIKTTEVEGVESICTGDTTDKRRKRRRSETTKSNSISTSSSSSRSRSSSSRGDSNSSSGSSVNWVPNKHH
ncbi:PAP/25A-associated [Trypanosoma melophagium]|uniref:PAP/25A-associated n=1 Tax=Trypanosoma melophagium TaxID=715481 RepID=UPI003519F46E|nr:PAP/25A-associated [Trypanosoma melophagium]